MTKNPDLRSVRVEIDDDVDRPGALDVPLVDTASKRSRFAGLVALVVLSLVVLVLIWVERDAGDAEDVVPTSTTVPEVEDEPEGGQFGTALSDPTELFQPTMGASQLESVVRVPSGFVGLTQLQTRGGLPDIVRSTDGIEWPDVDVVFDTSIPAPNPDLPQPVYERLIQTADGFALLMRTTEIDPEGETDRVISRISRLISTDAAAWSIDPNFAPFVSARSSTVVSHVEDSFVTRTRQPTENTLLKQLVVEHLDPSLLLEGACTARSFDEELQVLPCGDGDPIALSSQNALEPERFDLFAECAIFLGQRWASETSFWVVQPAQAVVELTGASSPLFAPSVAVDGRIVAIDYPSPPNAGERACGGFVDLGESPAPGVVVWNAEDPSQHVRYPIPAELEVSSLLSVRAEPTIANAGLLILIGSGLTSIDLTSIDLDTGTWEKVLTLPVRPDDETSVRITADGSRLIYLDSARVTVIELDTRLTGYVDTAGGNRPGFPQIVYADNVTVFARGGNSIFKIDVPTS